MKRVDQLFGAAAAGAAALTLTLLSASPSFAGPFSSFDGNWTGTGTVTTDNGTKERLRCKAHYDIGEGGSTLAQNLTCASDSYKFNVVSNVTAHDGSIDGTWTETSRNATGHITGSIGPTQISANVAGLGFTARIGIGGARWQAIGHDQPLRHRHRQRLGDDVEELRVQAAATEKPRSRDRGFFSDGHAFKMRRVRSVAGDDRSCRRAEQVELVVDAGANEVAIGLDAAGVRRGGAGGADEQ